MEKQLLIETRAFVPEVITETIGGEKVTVLRGLFSHAGQINQNKRIYPFDVLRREVNRLQEIIKERKLIGEIDHPSDGTIHLERASDLITELTMSDDGKVTGALQILTTPSGRILTELVNNKVTFGISSRAMGSVVESSEIPGALNVCQDLELITFDTVSEPSCTGAWLSLAEAKQRYTYNALHYGIHDADTKKALVNYIKLLIEK